VSPPAEVAAAIGFADQSHLTKRFKGAFDITPGQFAQAKQRQGDLAAI
jgi:AraC-like DNA-binding protein